MSDPLLSPDDVRRGLEALVDELVERGASTHIRVVGGAAVVDPNLLDMDRRDTVRKWDGAVVNSLADLLDDSFQ